jgi:hypothetical protein
MEDDEISLCNLCTDLVGLRKMETFPLRLLQTRRAGEWIGVHEFCLNIGVAARDVKPDLFAAWLPDPAGQNDFAVIFFYDDETKWSMAAHYHRARLLERAPSSQAKEPASVSVSPCAAAAQPTSAGEP